MTLRERIAEEIRRSGPIPFSRYMGMCLYDPELGYYSRAKEQFGRAGDFYTSSDVHAVFGRLLARQFDEMWRTMDSPARIDIVELGPGRGLFALDVFDWAKKKFPDFLHALHYTFVESSPALRRRLEERFSDRMGSCASPETAEACGRVSIVSSLDELGDALENVIIFGNEFFDALPVEVISSQGELRIGLEGNRFIETFVPPRPEVLEFFDRYSVHPSQGERAEATLEAFPYAQRIAQLVRHGFVLMVDYGYTREELLAGRSKNTVRAFRQHSISNTPYEAPGEQDITANVNFTAVRDWSLAAGMDQAWLLTQAQFLMGIGEVNQFADAFEDVHLPQEHAKVALQLKNLVTPVGMGEVFQVLLMCRGIDRDRVTKLSGMTFARSG